MAADRGKVRARRLPARGASGLPNLMSDLPDRLFRVTASVGFGWPACQYRERQSKNFTRADNAARWIANLARWPDHHQLESVHVGDVVWKPIDPADLGPPPEDAMEDE